LEEVEDRTERQSKGQYGNEGLGDDGDRCAYGRLEAVIPYVL
jgi:hypothetical protein